MSVLRFGSFGLTQSFFRGEQMLLFLRFICISLMLIVENLLLPDLKLGGRYLILLEAFLTAMIASFFHYVFNEMKIASFRSALTSFSILIVFFLVRFLFTGVNLSLVGILFLYLGTVLFEEILQASNFHEIV